MNGTITARIRDVLDLRIVRMLPAIAAPSGCPIVPQRSGQSGVSGVIVGPHRAGQGAPPPTMMRSAPSRSDAALSPLRCLVRRMYRYAVLASFGTDPQSRCTSIKYQLKSCIFYSPCFSQHQRHSCAIRSRFLARNVLSITAPNPIGIGNWPSATAQHQCAKDWLNSPGSVTRWQRL